MRALTNPERKALAHVSERLRVDPINLAALIEFESRWNPTIKNPNSSARGLIQFMDATAVDLGYLDSAGLVEAHPSTVSQLLCPVVRYLARYAPFSTDQSLFMAVFYPKFRNAPADQSFPLKVQEVNPGIRIVSDYVEKVWKRAGRISVDDVRVLAPEETVSGVLR